MTPEAAMMRSTLPYKNPDVFERIVLEHKVPLPRSLDSKLKRAIIGITGAVYPETGGGDDVRLRFVSFRMCCTLGTSPLCDAVERLSNTISCCRTARM